MKIPKGHEECEECPAKIGYDVADELEERQYYKEYHAIRITRRNKIDHAINRQRKERTRRKRW